MELEQNLAPVAPGSPVPIVDEEIAADLSEIRQMEAADAAAQAEEADATEATPPAPAPTASSFAQEAEEEAGLDFGESFEVDRAAQDAEYRKLGTMEFEPKNNVRTEFGRLGPDARCAMQNIDSIHMTPRGSIDYHPTILRFALDTDGVPLQLRGDCALRRGELLAPEEEAALIAENPEILTPFKRTRAQQWRWEVAHRRADPVKAGSWCQYISLCGDAPGQEIDVGEWPGLKMIEESRHPPRVESGAAGRRGSVKKESPGQLEFKKTAFDLLTKDSGGKIDRPKALTLASFWGYVPSELDKKRFLEKKDANLSYKEFTFWLTHALEHPEDRNLAEIKSAFSALDFNKTGLISSFALQNVLSEFGEGLTPEEIQEVVLRTSSEAQRGLVNYNDFVEELWAQNRKLPLPTVYTKLGLTTRQLPAMVETEVAHF